MDCTDRRGEDIQPDRSDGAAGDAAVPRRNLFDYAAAKAWPRQGEDCEGRPLTCDEIAFKLKEAEVMLAMQMAKDPGGIIGGGGVDNSPAGTFVSMQKLGDLQIEYSQFNNNVGSNCDDCSEPIGLSSVILGLEASTWLPILTCRLLAAHALSGGSAANGYRCRIPASC